MKEEKTKHAELQNTAVRWLYNLGCSVFPLEVPTENGIADALGIKTRDAETVYYIEAKASRSDLMCQKQKDVYARATGLLKEKCYYHGLRDSKQIMLLRAQDEDTCERCKMVEQKNADTGIDFYYFILADGVNIKEDEYSMFGVLNEQGEIQRRAKRMKRDGDTKRLIQNIAHVLVYKTFGKLYQV